MIVTETELRDQLRRPSAGARVHVPRGARLTPAATDFIKQWRLEVDPGSPVTSEPADHDQAATSPSWDRESSFPVALGGEVPRCTQCGGHVENKADGLTQLNASHFVAKNHPRIRLRGQVDTLHALVMLAQRHAHEQGVDWASEALGSLAAYCRELTSAEYNEREVAQLALPGIDEEAIHAATHDPRAALGIDHLTIGVGDPLLMHLLNTCRARSRELELTAVDAFGISPHGSSGPSICHALNRLSSAFYYLQLQLAKEAR